MEFKVKDHDGNTVKVGDRVNETGRITKIIEPEDHHAIVSVRYGDGSDENYHTQPRDDNYDVFVCDAITLEKSDQPPVGLRRRPSSRAGQFIAQFDYNGALEE